MELVDQIAEAVLYEGYLLYPYRRSALKNQQRWTFGGVFPRAFSETSGPGDPWVIETECLLLADEATRVDVELRFLHVLDRRVARKTPEGRQFVDELRQGSEVLIPWDEAEQRLVRTTPDGGIPLSELRAESRTVPFLVPAGSTEEFVEAAESRALLLREWRELRGEAVLSAASCGVEWNARQCWRLAVRMENRFPWPPVPAFPNERLRDTALRHSFLSTHFVLRVRGGEWVSLLDPPELLREAAASCRNPSCWPVLVGQAGEHNTLLSSPIILYDYPAVAPESRGDLFETTEIEELLTLSVLTLSDDEKQAMRESDPKAREILERTEALTPEQLLGMHGVIRSLRTLRPEEADPFWKTQLPVPESILVAGRELRRGSRVRLRPRAGGDIMDLALAGRTACVESIEQDFEDRVHIAVTVDDDPGQDLGYARQPGHRFFFSPQELEPLEAAE